MSRELPAANPVEELRRQLAADLAVVSGLKAVQRRGEQIATLQADLDRSLASADRPLVICLVGPTGAGKSTLINALAGQPIAQPGPDRPTTREPVVYAPADAALALPEGLDVRRVAYDPAGDGPWRGQVFIDSPDTNSAVTDHRDRVRVLAEAADVLLVTLHHQATVEQASVGFVELFRERRELVVVIGLADELAPDSIERLRRQVRQTAARSWGLDELPVFAVSAERAVDDPRQGGEFEALRQHLMGLADRERATAVRLGNARGAIGRLATVFGQVRAEVAPELAALPAAAAEALGATTKRLETALAQQLEARRTDFEGAFREQAARSWLGPGGAFLRLGSLGAAGLGAGGLLARRSLLGGLVLAASGAVLQRGAGALRGQRLSSELALPDEAALVDEASGLFVEVDARLERLGLAPEQLGLLPPARLVADTVARLSDSWQRAVEVELPQAARRWSSGGFRFVLDAPIYGLGGWVVWRTASGYLQGQYVGLDFLLSSAILAGVWAVAERTIAGLLIRRRARAELGRVVINEVRQVAAGRVQQVHNRCQRAVTAVREALDRLSTAGDTQITG